MREAAAARGPRLNPTRVLPVRQPLFRPMRNDHEARELCAPPQARLTPPRFKAKNPKNTVVHQELDARIRDIEAAIKRDFDASVKRYRRPPKEKEVEIPAASSTKEAYGLDGKKPLT